jgi:hypothetical protein
LPMLCPSKDFTQLMNTLQTFKHISPFISYYLIFASAVVNFFLLL